MKKKVAVFDIDPAVQPRRLRQSGAAKAEVDFMGETLTKFICDE